MSDNPLDSIPSFNRVSIRAVLVNEGEDPGQALSEAGIVDPIAVPVVLGEDLHLSSGILGNGVTPNLTGMLETEQEDDFNASPGTEPHNPGRRPDAAQPTKPVTTMLPAAFGLQPLAPVRRSGDNGQRADAEAGPAGDRAGGNPP